ncbi:hypothetical protein JW805_15910 [Roseomonas aeriglobus]|nr:hypothetical protein [Roseomonas aeriglobus]
MREARKFMNSDQKGVRDEIGFLIVHQRYADRFFPGTSVLHTRLRYVLFVPWLYRDEHLKPAKGQRAQESVKRREYLLTGRLINEPGGVIGSRNYPSPVEQRPSQVYWGALQRWGLVREQEGSGPLSRYQVERMIAGKPGALLKDDEGTSLGGGPWPFVVPEPADDWYSEGKGTLSFDLTRSERKFLAKRLRSLTSPRNPGARSIFSLLVGHDVSSSRTAWGPQVRDLAETERPALERAGHAAALAAIGRGVYAAQVETLCEELDRSKRSDTQRAALTGIVQRWKAQAARLDWPAFLDDMTDRTELAPVVSVALQDTLAWIRAGHTDPMRLERVYRDAEEARKGRRARLSRSQFGVDQRADWDNDHHPLGAPLHYR